MSIISLLKCTPFSPFSPTCRVFHVLCIFSKSIKTMITMIVESRKMGAEFYDLVSEWKSNFPYLKVNAARIDLFLRHDCFSIRFWTRIWRCLARWRGWKRARGFWTRVLVNRVGSCRRLFVLTCHQGWRKTFAQSSSKFWRFNFDVQQLFDFFLDRCLRKHTNRCFFSKWDWKKK